MRITGEQRPEYFEFFNAILGGEIRYNQGAKVITNLDNDGRIIVVTAYSMFTHGGCTMGVASIDDGKFFSKEYIRACFAYPFIQCALKRVQVVVNESNDKALRLVKRLGFVVEGRIRECFDEHDGILLGMLKKECKWLPT